MKFDDLAKFVSACEHRAAVMEPMVLAMTYEELMALFAAGHYEVLKHAVRIVDRERERQLRSLRAKEKNLSNAQLTEAVSRGEYALIFSDEKDWKNGLGPRGRRKAGA